MVLTRGFTQYGLSAVFLSVQSPSSISSPHRQQMYSGPWPQLANPAHPWTYPGWLGGHGCTAQFLRDSNQLLTLLNPLLNLQRALILTATATTRTAAGNLRLLVERNRPKTFPPRSRPLLVLVSLHRAIPSKFVALSSCLNPHPASTTIAHGRPDLKGLSCIFGRLGGELPCIITSVLRSLTFGGNRL